MSILQHMDSFNRDPLYTSLPELVVDDTDTNNADRSTKRYYPAKEPSMLSPNSALLSKPTMVVDGAADHPSGQSTPTNPFNFQTQVISTSPVKSVGITPALSIKVV